MKEYFSIKAGTLDNSIRADRISELAQKGQNQTLTEIIL